MIGFPKPQPRIVDRCQLKRELDRKAAAFKRAVWARDEGRCRHCLRKVIRTLELIPQAGHVHHRRGRNVTPEDRHNVDQAVLLCAVCHADPAVIQKFRPRKTA